VSALESPSPSACRIRASSSTAPGVLAPPAGDPRKVDADGTEDSIDERFGEIEDEIESAGGEPSPVSKGF